MVDRHDNRSIATRRHRQSTRADESTRRIRLSGVHVRPAHPSQYFYTIQKGKTFLTARRKPVTWLVEDLIPVPSTTILSGDGGTGKSLFSQALAVAVASGQPLFNAFVVPEPKTVVYVQTESAQEALQRRFLTIIQGFGLTIDDVGDRLIVIDNTDDPFQLDRESAKRFTREVIEGMHPGLVIIDPLVDFHSGDENLVKEMSPIVRMLRDWRDQHQVSTLLLHHTNKNPEAKKGAAKTRGSGILRTSMDGRWFVVLDERSGWSKMEELFLKEEPKGRLFRYKPVSGPDGTDFEFEWADETGKASPKERYLSDRQLLDKIRDRQPVGFEEVKEIGGYEYSASRRKILKLLEKGLLVEVEPKKVGKTKKRMFMVNESARHAGRPRLGAQRIAP